MQSKTNMDAHQTHRPIFWNYALDKGKLKSFVSWFLKEHGEKKTLNLLEELKVLGFGYATEAGISLGIEDLKIPPEKPKMLAKAKSLVDKSRFLYRRGTITDLERTQGFMEMWNEVNEQLKDEVVSYFQKTNILNPVYMMAFSGARGNLSQVRQLVGMRGLMSDPQGKIIDFPILSNFREGLTLTEYLISTYGARKGIVDTALRTATAGYLTRRLVDVAQHVVVSKLDCGTQRGIFLFDMKDGVKTIYSFQNRLIGRVLAQDIYEESKNNSWTTSSRSAHFPETPNITDISSFSPESGKEFGRLLAPRNTEVNENLASKIAKVTKRALVRSPLTCEQVKRVCQLCYGWSLATSRLVSIGEAVGVIAGQSIGEPGTQLTMRTFHTGGVFAGNITEQINAPFAGTVEYSNPIAGSLLRVYMAKNHSALAFLTKSGGTMILKSNPPIKLGTALTHEKPKAKIEETAELEINSVKTKTYKLPAFTLLFARHGESVSKQSVLAQIAGLSAGQRTQTKEQTVYTSLEGEVFYSHLNLIEEIDPKYGERVSKSEGWAKVWILSAKIFQSPVPYTRKKNDFPEFRKILEADLSHSRNAEEKEQERLKEFGFPKVKDFISKRTVVQEMKWLSPESFKSSEISVAGLKSLNVPPYPESRAERKINKWLPVGFSRDQREPLVAKRAKRLLSERNEKHDVYRDKNSSVASVFSFYSRPSTRFMDPQRLEKEENSSVFDLLDRSQLLLSKPASLAGDRPDNFDKKMLASCKQGKTQIFQNYQVRAKFLKTDKYKIFPTFMSYSFNEKKGFKVSMFLKNVQVFLPMMEAGTLNRWFKKGEQNYNNKYSRKGNKTKLQNMVAKVVSLRLKKKFSQKNKANHAQALILSNEIPFVLIKNRFALAFSFSPSNRLSSLKINGKTKMKTKIDSLEQKQSSTINKKHSNSDASLALQPNLENQGYFSNVTKSQGQIKKLRSRAFINARSKGSSGMQDLFMKQTLLTFPTMNPHYTKLGYSATSEFLENKKDCFFSYLPFKSASPIFRKKSLVALGRSESSSLDTAHNGIFGGIHGLKNTNFWQPKLRAGFVWYPFDYNIRESFVCLVKAYPFQFFEPVKTKTSAKIWSSVKTKDWQQKALSLLNLSQSQLCRKGLKFEFFSYAATNETKSKVFYKTELIDSLFGREALATNSIDKKSTDAFPLTTSKIQKFQYQRVLTKRIFGAKPSSDKNDPTILYVQQDDIKKTPKNVLFNTYLKSTIYKGKVTRKDSKKRKEDKPLFFKKYSYTQKGSLKKTPTQYLTFSDLLFNKDQLKNLISSKKNVLSKLSFGLSTLRGKRSGPNREALGLKVASESSKKSEKSRKLKKTHMSYRFGSGSQKSTKKETSETFIPQLKTILNQNQKRDLGFTEIFYLYQKNTVFHAWTNQEVKAKKFKKLTSLNKKIWFYNPKNPLKSVPLDFKLTNYQGFKKKIDLSKTGDINSNDRVEQNEVILTERPGVLTIRPFKKKSKQSIKKSKPNFFSSGSIGLRKIQIDEISHTGISALAEPLPSRAKREAHYCDSKVGRGSLKINFLKYLASKYEIQKLTAKKRNLHTTRDSFVFYKPFSTGSTGPKRSFSKVPFFRSQEKNKVASLSQSQSLQVPLLPRLRKNVREALPSDAKREALAFFSSEGLKEQDSRGIAKNFRAKNQENKETKVKINFKPGWIYKTSNVDPRCAKSIFSKNKKIQDFGKGCIDDLHLEGQKVLWEPLQLEKIIRFNEELVSPFSSKAKNTKLRSRDNNRNFIASKWLGNRKCRFFSFSQKQGFQSSHRSLFERELSPFLSTSAQSEHSSKRNHKSKEKCYLIRPFESKKIESVQERKTILYENMKKYESLQLGISYQLYKNYGTEDFNLQNTEKIFIGLFPKLDIELQPISIFGNWRLQKRDHKSGVKANFRKNKQERMKTKSELQKENRAKRQNKVSSSPSPFVEKSNITNEKRLQLLVTDETMNNTFKNKKSSKLELKGQKRENKLKIFKIRRFSENTRNPFVKDRGTQIFVLKSKKKKEKNLTLYKNMHFPFYASNQSLNLSPYIISYKLSKPDWEGYSFPNLSFSNRPDNLFLRKPKNQQQKTFLHESLNRMLKNSRSLFSQSTSLESSNTIQDMIVKPTSKSVKYSSKKNLSIFSKTINSSSIGKVSKTKFETFNQFLHYFYYAPKLEFTLNLHYSFFMNARLRSSGSWKNEFASEAGRLKRNFSQGSKSYMKTFPLERLLKTHENRNILSAQQSPLSKNFLNVNKNSKKQKGERSFAPKGSRERSLGGRLVGFTRFYSPFEGLVLKDYAFEKMLDLKKTLNIDLDEVLLQERQGQKLILTKDDLFSLKFPTNETGKRVSQKRFEKTFKHETLMENKSFETFAKKQAFFEKISNQEDFQKVLSNHTKFQTLEKNYIEACFYPKYEIRNVSAKYEDKTYTLKQVDFEPSTQPPVFRIGKFSNAGDSVYSNLCLPRAGQVIHLNSQKVTFRKAEYFSLLPRAILHAYNGHTIQPNNAVMTLPFETLNSGDIVQGIPKVEQYLEARTTIQGRLFLNSLPVLLYALYKRYLLTLEMEKAVRQSFLKIQQILVDGVQRVYRSQGVGITDKHLEVIVRQMTSKVKIIYGGQTGFFPGELVDLELVEKVNRSLVVKVIYEPIVLGITRASLEVDSFLSAASFQQTTKVLTRAALENKRDFLKGLKENLLVGNLLPAGTGYVVPSNIR